MTILDKKNWNVSDCGYLSVKNDQPKARPWPDNLEVGSLIFNSEKFMNRDIMIIWIKLN